MKKIYTVLFAIMILHSCSDETTFFNEGDKRIDLSLENDKAALNNGINTDNNGILEVYFEHELSAKNGFSSKNSTSDYHLNLVGQMDRPAFNTSSNLTATHIDVQDNFAYVSYNTIGEKFEGAVDVIDLSDSSNPVLVSRMYTHHRDANVVMYDDGYLYVLGGVDMDLVLEATGGSYIAKIGVNNGVVDLDNVTFYYQEGHTATGITKMGNAYFVTTGANGSIAKYDSASFVKSDETKFSDLLSVASKNGRLAILNATTGVTLMDENLNEIAQIATRTDFMEDAKRTIAMTADKLIVPEGDQGAGVYNLNNGALEERLPILIDPENVAPSDKVANAVAVNGDAILMANGGAGLAIKVKNDIVDLMGVVELSGSINYVVSDKDYIFAASGTSGLQIISKIRTDESLVVAAGVYVVRARNSGRAMALSSPSVDNGIGVVQDSRSGTGQTEQWRLEILGSGAYTMTNTFSGGAAQKDGGSGKFIEQSQYVGNARQQWAVEPAAEEGYFYIRNLSDNKYLDVRGNSSSVGASIIVWGFHGNRNQQWSFEKVSD